MMKILLLTIGAFLLAAVGALFYLFLAIFLGYTFGMLLAILPFIGDALTEGAPITRGQLPMIGAWLAVLALFLRQGRGAKLEVEKDAV